jgi:hypothetical protein
VPSHLLIFPALFLHGYGHAHGHGHGHGKRKTVTVTLVDHPGAPVYLFVITDYSFDATVRWFFCRYSARTAVHPFRLK